MSRAEDIVEDKLILSVAAISPQVHLANPAACAQEILDEAKKAAAQGVRLVVFPELALTGATCADLFLQDLLIASAQRELIKLAQDTKELPTVLVVGLPLQCKNHLYNAAAVLHEGQILGIVPKVYSECGEQHLQQDYCNELSAQQELRAQHEQRTQYEQYAQHELLAQYEQRTQHERRWFSNGAHIDTTITIGDQNVPCGPHLVFEIPGAEEADVHSLIVTIGNDYFFDAVRDGHCCTGSSPKTSHTCIANPHATPAIAAPFSLEVFVQSVARERSLPIVRAGAGEGESTTDCVLNGSRFVLETGGLNDVNSSKKDVNQARQDVNLAHADSNAAQEDESIAQEDSNRAHKLQSPQDAMQTNRSPQPFTTSDPETIERVSKEALSIQTKALVQRLKATHIQKVVIGISGGLDSTLALLVCCNAFDQLGLPRQDIYAISMPGLGTTQKTRSNAKLLAEGLGVSYQEISIAEAVAQHFKDISHNPAVQNAAYENAQARERTQILMDFANDLTGIVVGTGDMSEAALGWATFNGDHMSMYNVNAGVPKTLVKAIVATRADSLEENSKYADSLEANIHQADSQNADSLPNSVAHTLRAILDTPISPELLPPSQTDAIQQKTEDVVGPYELHDFFLYHFVCLQESPAEIYKHACSAFPQTKPETVLSWLRVFLKRFFSQQFKRSCAVDGPQVVAFSLSPRSGFEMPSDAQVDAWLEELK